MSGDFRLIAQRSRNKLGPFVACFSAEEDDLTQWDCRLGVEEAFEGFEKYLLLPAKHLRRDRGAHDKRHGQCGQVARVRPPRVALPNPFEK